MKLKDPLLTMTLRAPNETLDKGNLGQKGFSDNTKVDFRTTKDHGQQWVLKPPGNTSTSLKKRKGYCGGMVGVNGGKTRAHVTSLGLVDICLPELLVN